MSMAGKWVCPNCQIPRDHWDTDQTRCLGCGLQMDWVRAKEINPSIPTGIERFNAEAISGR